MRMFTQQIFVILIIFVWDSSCVLETLHDIGKKIWQLNSLIDEADLSLMQGPKGFAEMSPNQELRDHIQKIHIQLRAMERSIKPNMFESLMGMMRSRILVFKYLDTMGLFVASIDDDYEQFNDYVFNGELEKLKALIIPTIKSKILMIRKLIIDTEELLQDDKNLVNAIAGYVTINNAEICGGPQLFTEGLVHLFRMAVLAEIKTFVILSVANKYEYLKDEAWKAMNYLARREVQKYFGDYVNIVELNLNLIEGSYVRACDPENGNWILNKNFYELTDTVKAVIFQYDSKICWSETCESTWDRKWSSCDVKNFNERSRCSSLSTKCTSLGTVEACLLKNHPHTFRYINSTELGLLGKNFDCPSDIGYIIDDPKYHTCNCDCYGGHNKISLLIFDSNWKSNMVITGIRFIRKNNTLYIQPKVGKLMANGYIDPNSESWITIPDDIEINKPSQFPSINETNRYFFLDDVRLPAYYVLTGVQFQHVRRGSLLGFGIRIFGTPFNYTTGQLDISSEIERFIDTDVSGKHLIFKPMNPIQTKLHQTVSSGSKYVALRPSDFINDSKQSTLPLFDAAPVTTNPSSPLGGVGIFHKGTEDYAGFISLRIFGIRYKEYFVDFIHAEMVADLVLFH